MKILITLKDGTDWETITCGASGAFVAEDGDTVSIQESEFGLTLREIIEGGLAEERRLG